MTIHAPVSNLSIVIVSYNVQDLLQACLISLTTTASVSLDPQVIVVDNGSEDDSVHLVRRNFPYVTLIANEVNAGFAAATNQGIQASSGKYVLILNPDTEVRGNALEQLYFFLENHPEYAMAGPGLRFPDGSFQHGAFRFPGALQCLLEFFPINHRVTDSWLNGRYTKKLYMSSEHFDIDHPLGACMFVRREIVEEIGLLDERFFMYCEEVDWCWRMKEAGWQIACLPTARVTHHAGASTQQFRDKMFVALWQSRLRLFEKHLGANHNRLIKWIIRVGLQRERLNAIRQASNDNMPLAGLTSRLAAYEEVARMTHI